MAERFRLNIDRLFAPVAAPAPRRRLRSEIAPRPTPMLPDDARRRAFFMLNAAMSAVTKPGSRKCTKAMAKADAALTALPAGVTLAASGAAEEARLMLRARCGACPKRCEGALL